MTRIHWHVCTCACWLTYTCHVLVQKYSSKAYTATQIESRASSIFVCVCRCRRGLIHVAFRDQYSCRHQTSCSADRRGYISSGSTVSVVLKHQHQNDKHKNLFVSDLPIPLFYNPVFSLGGCNCAENGGFCINSLFQGQLRGLAIKHEWTHKCVALGGGDTSIKP